MDNQAFKKLLLQNNKNASSSSPPSSTPRLGGGATPNTALGSRLKPSIPMTPRSVSLSSRALRNDFARQLAEQNSAEGKEPAAKKFRTSAPKGSRFAAGYVDRARQRQEEEEDERTERLRELERRLKDEEIDREEYERERVKIAGGDLESTHLVKGLDFKLLERVRKGEVDVLGEKGTGKKDEEEEQEEDGEEEQQEEDPDDVLERLAAEVKPVEKEKVQKKGTLATVPGQKRSRDQILAELKAAREAAKAKAESALGSKFKKIGERPKPGTRIEWDTKGREVMIIVDEDGNEKRKIRRIDPKVAQEEKKEEFKPAGEVLGMEVPEFYKQQQAEELARQKEQEEKEISIFDDAGSDYDPLAGMDGSSDESSSEDEGEVAPAAKSEKGDMTTADDTKAMPPPPKPAPARPNYFKDSKTGLISTEEHKRPDLNDPTVLAALRKAKALDMQTKSEEEIKAAEREAKLKKMLEASSRDDADMDMGFGSSRVEDEADFDETRVKLSQWGDEEEDDDEGGRGGGKAKRKRGGKKRKGDKDSFKDVMSVIERRKGDKA
ncbi:Protein Red [Coniochaeta hoffmannii]|uniref:Protein Red n=1 Tax=Coniochaeta hoffmannii TaxID=91930 RepID=A0AA38S463_9PEZI|nr:Protein Red [Coniochaeta hoffmannii]